MTRKAPGTLPLSIIIPAHNAAPHLARCLEGLRANDLTETEFILVDDASSDETSAIAEQYGCRVVRCEHQAGPAVARNRGAGEALHPYLFFVDSDVVLPPDTVTNIRETLDLYSHRPDVAGVLGQYSEAAASERFVTNYRNLMTCHLYNITETQSPYLHTPIFCVRKEVLEAAGGFDPHLWRAEDFRLGVVLGSGGYRFIIDRKIKGLHLKRYTFAGALKEDWLRIRDLQSVRLDPSERAFALRAHRWPRLLSLALPGAILLCSGLGFLHAAFILIGASLFTVFLLLNARFLMFSKRKRGTWFAVQAAGFLFVEMLWAEVALAAGILRSAFRKKSSGES